MFLPEGLASFHDAMHGLVDDGTVPGVVTLLAQDDEVHIDAVGVGPLASGAPMRDDAIVRIQSMTKPILAAATMRLAERADVRLGDPVERWLPELANRKVLRTPASELDDVVPARRPITVEDLLTCRSGYGMVIGESPISRAMRERGVDVGPTARLWPSDTWLARLAELPLIHQPGEGWRYHISFDILGILLSRVAGTSLEDHLRETIFDPLGMPDTAMFLDGERAERLVAVYHHDENGALVEDEPAGGGYHVGYPPYDISRGELVSTARDYHRFATMLMRGGEIDGVRLLSPESVAMMTRDHIGLGTEDARQLLSRLLGHDRLGLRHGHPDRARRLRPARPLQLVGRLRHHLVQRPEHRPDRHRAHAGPARRPDDERHRRLLPCRLRHDHVLVGGDRVSTRST